MHHADLHAISAGKEKLRQFGTRIASLSERLSDQALTSRERELINIREVDPLRKQIKDYLNTLPLGHPVREEAKRTEGDLTRIAHYRVRLFSRNITEEEYRLAEANQNVGRTNSERLKNKRAFQLAERSFKSLRDSGKQQS